MKILEHVSLAPHTTLHIGGTARYFCTVETEQEVRDACAFARDKNLPVLVLGAGSNILVPDEEITALVMNCALKGITLEEQGATVQLTAGAGEQWDAVVDVAAEHGLFGIENLAGIPGTMGGAVVQNIGAYGAEFSQTFLQAETIDATGEVRVLQCSDAAFAYRTSVFKEKRELIIMRVTLSLSKQGAPALTYADLARAASEGVPLTTPREVVTAVRAIRSRKFPDLSVEGTAGSFFKNPQLQSEQYAALVARYPALPGFPQKDGTVKIPLAWILDHVLGLKGFAEDAVRLYEQQPIVLVARSGATARDVDAFAKHIAEKVFAETGISIEREVETFGV